MWKLLFWSSAIWSCVEASRWCTDRSLRVSAEIIASSHLPPPMHRKKKITDVWSRHGDMWVSEGGEGIHEEK
jgi:hypothetical protein